MGWDMPYMIEQVKRLPVGQKKMPRWAAVVAAVARMVPNSDESIWVPLSDGEAEGMTTVRGMSTSIQHAVRGAGMCVTTAEETGKGLNPGIRIWRLKDGAGAGGGARVAMANREAERMASEARSREDGPVSW